MAGKSFLPEDYIEKRRERRTNLFSLTLFVIVLGGVVAAYFVTDQQRQDVHARMADVNQRSAQVAAQLDEMTRLQEQKKQMLRKASITGQLVERVPRTVLLAELVNNMPSTLSLLSLELETKKVKTTNRARTLIDKKKQEAAKKNEPDLPDTDVTIGLIGVAPTDVEVAQFMAALSRCELFNDVNLVFSETKEIEEQEMRQFRIELMLNQDVDMTTFTPSKVARGIEQNPMSPDVQFNPDGSLALPE